MNLVPHCTKCRFCTHTAYLWVNLKEGQGLYVCGNCKGDFVGPSSDNSKDEVPA